MLFHVSLLMSGLAILPGCFQKEETAQEQKAVCPIDRKVPAGDSSEVVATIGPDKRPLLTAKMLDGEIETIIESNPQFATMFVMQPQYEKEIAKGIVQQDVIREYVKREKLDQTPEYQAEYQKGLKQARQVADGKVFMERHSATITDKQVQDFYDEEKDKNPQFMVSRGGSQAMGVPFATQEEAKSFLAKAKSKPTRLEAVAKQADLKDDFKDFNLVSQMSFGIDPAVKAEVLKVAKVPSVQMVKGDDDKFWVVAVTKKEEPTYHEFAKIKDQLKQYLTQQKQVEAVKTALEGYMEDYQVNLNDDYFTKRLEEKQQVQAQKQDQLKQAMMAQNDQKTAEIAKEDVDSALEPAQTV